ncbi:hypothetical protein PJK54_05915 [Cobetia sp. MMG027]|nr:hypothetical protein [Cobetia sp. MMG027]MDA5563198.1 hypothetical protein [Cobetia sp. MMG027]
MLDGFGDHPGRQYQLGDRQDTRHDPGQGRKPKQATLSRRLLSEPSACLASFPGAPVKRAPVKRAPVRRDPVWRDPVWRDPVSLADRGLE